MFQKVILFLLISLFGVNVAFGCSAAVTIDVSWAPYKNLPLLDGTNAFTEIDILGPALTQVAGTYRSIHGFATLPTGSNFKVEFGDGSSICALVTSVTSSYGATPIPGTASKGNTSGGGGNAGGGSLHMRIIAVNGYQFTCFIGTQQVDCDTGNPI